MKNINSYTGKPSSNNSLEGFVISSTNSSFNNNSNILKGYVNPSMLKHSSSHNYTNDYMKHRNYNYTHDIHWQNSQNFISLLDQKEQKIKSYEKSYQTLSGTKKTEFINSIKSTTLDHLKHELKNNYFEPDMIISFKTSIERLESIIDGWVTGVIQQPKQPNPNYLKLDQYTSQQLSAKEFVDMYNTSIDSIEKHRESLDQLTHDKKLELVDQIKPKIIYSLEQQLRTGIYSPNARFEYEQAIKKLVVIINDLALLPVIEQPNQNIPVQPQNNHQQQEEIKQEEEDEEMIQELRAQLEQLIIQMSQRDNTIQQQANDLITKDNIIAEKDNTLAEQDNIISLLKTENHDVKDANLDLTNKLAASEEKNEILTNENHSLTDKLNVSEEKNTILQNKLVVSEAKVTPLQEKIQELKIENKELKDDKIDLRKDKEMLVDDKKMLADDKKMLQDEKKLLLVDKKYFQDLSLEQTFKIAELSLIHCNVPEHKEWELLNVPLTGVDNIQHHD